MNSTISQLLIDLEQTKNTSQAIRDTLQDEYNKVFNDDSTLAKVISLVENSTDYSFDENGEIESTYKWYGMSDYVECKEYLQEWLFERCIRVNWEHEYLGMSQGENLIIQDDSYRARDNGVWLSGKCVINETDYLDESGEVDETKRNELIEAYMEKSGYFPGVFRADQHGNVFHVITQKKV